MPVVKNLKVIHVPLEQSMLYHQLVEILSPYSRWFQVKENEPYRYELWTEHVYRVKSNRPKAKRGVLFAGIAAYKSYVGFYFYPLHINQLLRGSLKNELSSMIRGSSTFHFNYLHDLNDEIEAQVKELLENGWNLYQKNGWITRRS